MAMACAARLLWGDATTRQLLRPQLRSTGWGLLGAAVMIAGTYVLYGPLCAVFSGLPRETEQLYQLLRSGASSTLWMLVLITAVSASEEIIWRGRTLTSAGDTRPARPSLRQTMRVFGFALVYGLAHAASGFVTLIGLAFLCGLFWGLLRVATRSLWAPILTHVLWDVSVMIVWPLA